ncbi:MAG: DUF6178 family protein [Myxococcaceae bacterium]
MPQSTAVAPVLSRMPAGSRLDALISASNAPELVRSQPAEMLYATIQEVGLADSAELVQLASPEQFRTFVDLGGWKKDRIDAAAVLTWLRAARGEESEEFLEKVHAVDVEVLEVVLRQMTEVHDLRETPDIQPQGVVLESPEGHYLIDIKADGADLAGLRQLLNDWMAENPFEFGRFMEALRWELPSELEETAFRFRCARLEDLGFPPPEAAARLWSYIRPSAPLTSPTQPALTVVSDGRWLEHAVQVLDEGERETLEQELRYLVNTALVAEGAEPGVLEDVRAVSERVRDTLSLGLEYLSGGDVSRAGQVLRVQTSQRVFQTGFSLTLELKFEVDRWVREPGVQVGKRLLLLPYESQVVAALRRRKPLRALKVEGAEPVPFRSLRELAEVRGVVQRARTQARFFSKWLGEKPADALAALGPAVGDQTPAERLLHVLVARQLAGLPLCAEPLPHARLGELAKALAAPSGSRLAALEAAFCEGVAPDDENEIRRMAQRALEVVSGALEGTARTGKALDPVLVEGLIPLSASDEASHETGSLEPV